ncbi:F0F1 ATP synthase subunit B [Mycolicibacterium psychrotolerans]|jgi:F-type H+-transporting ATPase subunit b|uniref:ATP synthase subunit b n=2 Tax=Mycolicibacterium TaxID=1866885 RepID=A0AAD1HP78_9MYCO|nr:MULTISPECIES: F0F1 ATP synthase subunit B [Mycobacteriaceae]MBI3691695.1 F0F1 ATP synthase subunit B [Mycolicibacterium aromaticivorans]MCV7021710.1 F0F1 ATP synthase subunit B [Mycolicibacterium aichiense]MCV7342946.1 F0F1 ATP synthase subunit B [Mycolicibacterium rhodesiae]ORB47746.1 F0F1 ATP synthase subunit B [Mycolicibacterium rhodesiae]QEN13282.1 F0F1 ATP synthase subunit B [Mycobacterium sp. ELW1]
MGEHSVTLLAAEEGGTQNFLVPNGTFFFVLAIFLIVLGVIGKFVVPPVQKVLGEREKMVAKTTENNRKATELDAAADSDFQKVMAEARTEASGIRDEARAEGRKILEEHRGRASEEAAATLQQAADQLKQQSDSISGDLRSSVDTLSATLASRVLGVEVSSESATTAPGR